MPVPFFPSAFLDKLFSLNDYYNLKYWLNEHWEKDHKWSLQSSQMKKEDPCKLGNSKEVCDTKLLKICKMPLLEIWWSSNGDTSKDTVNIFMKTIHKTGGFFFPCYGWDHKHTWHTQPAVFSVGTSESTDICFIRKVVLYQWWKM